MNLQGCVRHCRLPWLHVVAGFLMESSSHASCLHTVITRPNPASLPSHTPKARLQQRAFSKGGEQTQVPSPRVVIESQHLSALPLPVLPIREPISHCTSSHAPAPLSLFTAGQPLHKCVTYHIPTAKSVQPTAEPIGLEGSARPCILQKLWVCIPLPSIDANEQSTSSFGA
jgi:hypothetical protein